MKTIESIEVNSDSNNHIVIKEELNGGSVGSVFILLVLFAAVLFQL